MAKTTNPEPVVKLLKFAAEGCRQLALPFAAMPVAKLFAGHWVGVAARAVAVEALKVPVMFPPTATPPANTALPFLSTLNLLVPLT